MNMSILFKCKKLPICSVLSPSSLQQTGQTYEGVSGEVEKSIYQVSTSP